VTQPTRLRCIRCHAHYVAGRLFKGCRACFAQGHPANLAVEYDYDAIRRRFDPKRLEGRPISMWRYHELLPAAAEDAVSPWRRHDTAPVGAGAGSPAWRS
jgi:hypothetical protein